MDHELTFETPEPLELDIKWGIGEVALHAQEGLRQTVVGMDGPESDIEACLVELRGSRLVIEACRQNKNRFLSINREVRLDVVVPAASSVLFEVGSSDVTADGRWERAQGRSGSGEISFEAVSSARLECGSGGITVQRCEGDAELKSGSGDLEIAEALGNLRAASGSGDIEARAGVRGSLHATSGSGDITVGPVEGSARVQTASGDIHGCTVAGSLSAKTASGSIEAECVQGGVQAHTASGDIRIDHVGASEQVQCTTASGSVELGIPQGRKVWAEVTSLTGDVYADLERQGQPAEGESYLTLRVNTVSGDISLQQV